MTEHLFDEQLQIGISASKQRKVEKQAGTAQSTQQALTQEQARLIQEQKLVEKQHRIAEQMRSDAAEFAQALLSEGLEPNHSAYIPQPYVTLLGRIKSHPTKVGVWIVDANMTTRTHGTAHEQEVTRYIWEGTCIDVEGRIWGFSSGPSTHSSEWVPNGVLHVEEATDDMLVPGAPVDDNPAHEIPSQVLEWRAQLISALDRIV